MFGYIWLWLVFVVIALYCISDILSEQHGWPKKPFEKNPGSLQLLGQVRATCKPWTPWRSHIATTPTKSKAVAEYHRKEKEKSQANTASMTDEVKGQNIAEVAAKELDTYEKWRTAAMDEMEGQAKISHTLMKIAYAQDWAEKWDAEKKSAEYGGAKKRGRANTAGKALGATGTKTEEGGWELEGHAPTPVHTSSDEGMDDEAEKKEKVKKEKQREADFKRDWEKERKRTTRRAQKAAATE